ncbi:MAG: T9SS type A sorting domain-containing protein [Bacteroidales bacterium]|nr:T9SS type A sorting domain-containing protein [Bacteroidales bacterium]MCF6341223.1 T9SS type A sorting domain-containing protein [Bacteroidales bacterium]
MKNIRIKLLTVASILLTTVSMNAQEMYLSWEGETLGDTLTIWGSPDSSEIVFHAVVHNMTVNWMEIKVRRNRLEMPDSTSGYFCWGPCFAEHVEESPDSILIPSGGSSADTAFSGHYIPNAAIGTAVVEYTFYNAENEDQYVKLLVKYWASPEGIAEDPLKGGSISNLYPNPATRLVSFDFVFPEKVKTAGIRITNLFGRVLKEVDIVHSSGKLTVDVGKLESGVYFYSLLLNGHVYETKKLVIR